MKHILTTKQMQDLDRKTITERGIPSLILMENAGTACVEVILEKCHNHLNGTVAIACGNGNNGGDGYVIARLLQSHGVKVFIIRIGEAPQSAENKANFDRIIQRGIGIIYIYKPTDIKLLNPYIEKISLVVDAIFGIGFRGIPDELHSLVFNQLNALPAYRVAIDIPSGLCAETGNAEVAVRADLTIAIEALKFGHLLVRGREFSGALCIVHIGIPPAFYEEIKYACLIDAKDHETPSRSPFSHKSDYGRAFIIAGSHGFTGAALLAARAALRSGAGYVNLMYRPELRGIFDTVIPEILCTQISSDNTAHEPDRDAFIKQLERAGAVLIGPGFGIDAYAEKALQICLEHVSVPLILDADAITIVARNPHLLEYLAKPNVLITPHVGEFIRIADLNKEGFNSNQLLCVHEFVEKHKAKVLLKSYTTIYMDEDNTIFSIAGNDGLATGGSGDVLGGIICAFCAQKMPLHKAAINASFLMGSTAERLSRKRFTASIIPSDIIEHIFCKEVHDA